MSSFSSSNYKTFQRDVVSASLSQTEFSLSQNPKFIDQISVHKNGIKQFESLTWTYNLTTNIITWSGALNLGGEEFVIEYEI